MPLLSSDEIVRLIEARRFDLIEHHHLAVDRLIQDVIRLGQTPKHEGPIPLGTLRPGLPAR